MIFAAAVAFYICLYFTAPALTGFLGFSRLSIELRRSTPATLDFVSFLHAIWATVASVYLWSLSRNDDRPPIHRGSSVESIVMNVGMVFMAYLVCDGFFVILYRKDFPNVAEMLAHHAVFLLACIFNSQQGRFFYMFGYLYFGELSSIFLGIRSLLKRLKVQEGSTWQAVNVLFALTFFLSRVVIMSFLLWDIFSSLPSIRSECSIPQQVMFLLLIPAGWLLNMVWMTRIVQIAIKTVTAKSSSGGKKDKKIEYRRE